jgi:hypothetical protein
MWHPDSTSLHIICRGYSERVNAEINRSNLQSLSTTLDPDRRTLSHMLMCLVNPLVFGNEFSLVRTV